MEQQEGESLERKLVREGRRQLGRVWVMLSRHRTRRQEIQAVVRDAGGRPEPAQGGDLCQEVREYLLGRVQQMRAAFSWAAGERSKLEARRELWTEYTGRDTEPPERPPLWLLKDEVNAATRLAGFVEKRMP